MDIEDFSVDAVAARDGAEAHAKEEVAEARRRAQIAAAQAREAKLKQKEMRATAEDRRAYASAIRMNDDFDNAEEREELIRKIEGYYNVCGHRIKRTKPRRMESLSIAELQTLLGRIESDLNSFGGKEALWRGICLAAQVAENFETEDFRLSGPLCSFSATIEESQGAMEETLDELAVKYGSWLAVPPEVRLVGSLAILIREVAAANARAAAHGASVDHSAFTAPPPPSMASDADFSDL